MENSIDCLLIGHNEMSFPEYVNSVKQMGANSGAYRDLEKNFLQYNNRPYCVSEIFNMCCTGNPNGAASVKPFHIGETFNAAVAYLGTWLHRRGFTYDFVNSFQDKKQELAEKLTQNNILTIAIITTLYISVFPILEIIDFIKQYNNTAKIIIGGPFVANNIRTLDPPGLGYLFKSIGADFFVNSSQGEAALVKIIQHLKNGLALEQIENIYYKNADGYVFTFLSKENNQLSENMVDWNLFDGRVGEFVNVRTSISCPFSCAFCGFPQHAGQYQTAPVVKIQEELDRLARLPAVTSVNFIDDTFNVPVKRFKEILRLMIKNRYPFKWHSHLRCQFIDEETIEFMKTSGCEGVFLGIESGSREILKNMNKNVDIEKYLRGIRLLKQYDILTYGSFIIGFPGETDKTAAETISFIKDSSLDFYRAQLWYCDTVTPIWQQRDTYRINGSHFQWSHATMDGKRACDLVDEIFLTVKDPVWVPQYNFEFNGIFHLLHRGIPCQQVKQFLKNFNNGIKEKLMNPSRKELSSEILRQLKNAFHDRTDNENNTLNGLNGKKNPTGDYDAQFDFG